MTRSVLIPITNVYAKGDYAAEVHIGSQKQRANPILDTGSSTMVVQQEDYDPSQDKALQATEHAQNIIYGMGGWYGPVIKTQVSMGSGDFPAELADAYIAVTRKEQANSFGLADGILGLAYHESNCGYNLHSYLQDNQNNPAKTYPWCLASEQADDYVRDFQKFRINSPTMISSPISPS